MTTGRQVAEAFEAGKKAIAGNYFTDGKGYYLFGNLIAEHRDDGIYFSNAGYTTVTTAKALNFLSWVSYSSRSGQAFNHGVKIESNKFYKVDDPLFMEALKA